MAGVVTLERILEKILQEQIEDEEDRRKITLIVDDGQKYDNAWSEVPNYSGMHQAVHFCFKQWKIEWRLACRSKPSSSLPSENNSQRTVSSQGSPFAERSFGRRMSLPFATATGQPLVPRNKSFAKRQISDDTNDRSMPQESIIASGGGAVSSMPAGRFYRCGGLASDRQLGAVL